MRIKPGLFEILNCFDNYVRFVPYRLIVYSNFFKSNI